MKLPELKFFFFYLIFFLQCTPFFAQSPSYINYTIDDGLPSNTVYYSFQDSKGFMWFATDKGVVRFDGTTFQVFTTSDGLTDNECFDIFEDSKQRIWFSTYNGDPCYYLNGKFYNRHNTVLLDNVRFSNYGVKVLEDKNGTLFYVTLNKVYALKKEKFVELDLKQNFYSSLYLDDNDNCFVLAQKDDNTTKIIPLSSGVQNPEINLPFATHYSSKTYFSSNQLHFTNKSELLTYDFRSKQSYPKQFGTLQRDIQCIGKIGSEFWIGTENGVYLKEKPRQKPFLKSASISNIREDREKNIWLCSLNEGVFLLVNREVFVHNKRTGLGFDYCASVHDLKEKTIGIGSQEYRCAFLNQGQTVTHQLLARSGTGHVQKMMSHKGLYYISFGSGLQTFDKKFRPSSQRILTQVKDFVITPHDTFVWVGGTGVSSIPLKDIFLMKIKNPTLYYVNKLPVKCHQIYQTPANKIYISGVSGIYEIHATDVERLSQHTILEKNILDSQQDKHGVLWICSSVHGLIALYKNQVYSFSIKDGLPTNYVTSIAIDEKNTLWLGTTKGLCQIKYVLSRNGIEIKANTYSEPHGLISSKINDVIIARDTVWLATDKGLCFFSKQALWGKKQKPILQLKSFLANNINQGTKNRYVLEADQNRLQISYIGISFRSFGKLYYKYRFMNGAKKWNYTQASEIEFSSLASGKYRLEIAAIDAYGNSSVSRLLFIEIKPHFYQTWWFYLILSIGFGTLIYIWTNKRFKKIKDKHRLNEKLLRLEHDKLKIEHSEALLQKEYVELEQKALLLQMNPHFIFNSINTIQGLYKNNPTQADEYLIKFSNLLRQILEFSQQKIISLEAEINFLIIYLEINKLRFEYVFEFEVQVAPNLNATGIGISPMIIQPFVENALIHGIQSLRSGGLISLKFYLDGAHLVCELTDNGVGRAKASERSKYQIHHSLGMDITEKRLNYFNKGHAGSALELIDLFDDGKAAGTKVIITLVYTKI